ncbi:transporter substrate-binding domain-containing protein [Moraxella bovis]|uniref:transporter substrate-binding domain-containing protein n=1 Tax=Moraxella bovis TaxID=476 RepID=UPI00222639A1|nr:transporter substrate-binding domain-containing protein [Moraxella bovis]UZA07052.1 transporter substrate-binding domain-containing protein [Moraxella bovis]UZA10718.1 transporter substrate-binding domain-containing protein [Moraxella bovis]
MKSLFTVMLLCVFTLMGCGDKNNASESIQEELKDDLDQKVYKVLTYPHYAPYEYLDEKGGIIGFDVDMIQAIAQSQNFKVEIINSPWEDMLGRLNTGEADLVISGISRQQAGGDADFALSNAYLHGRDSILTKEGVTNINTFEDMVVHNIGVQSNTIFADELIAKKGEGNPTLKLSSTSFLAFSDLVNDKVEAVYAHENILRHYAKGQPNLKFNFNGTGEGFDYYNMVVVAKKGNDELIAKIDAGIQDVHQNGTYQKLHSQWFGVEAPTPMIKNKNRY